MSASAVPVQSPAPAPKLDELTKEKDAAAQPPSRWHKYVTPVLELGRINSICGRPTHVPIKASNDSQANPISERRGN
jgi:hypothetical protein